MRNIRATGKDVVLPPDKYLLQQILMMNPASLPFWFGGLLFYFFARDAKIYRALGWAFVITISFLMITHGKDYYSAPAYIMLFAAGAAATERLFEFSTRRRLRSVLRPACFIWLLLGVVPLLPLVLPVFPIDTFLGYQSRLPFEVPKTERSFVGETLPQYYADEFPWPGLVAAVARVYHSLTAGRTKPRCNLRHKLWPGGGNRFFWTTVWITKSNQRTSKLFSLGTAALHRRNCDLARRGRERGARGLRFSNRRCHSEQSLCVSLRKPACSAVQRFEVEFANGMGQSEEVALTNHRPNNLFPSFC